MKKDEWLHGTEQAEGPNEVQNLSAHDNGFDALLTVFKKLTVSKSRQSLKHEAFNFEGFYFVGKLRDKEEMNLILTCVAADIALAIVRTQRLDVVRAMDLAKFKRGGYKKEVSSSEIGKQNGLVRVGQREFKISCSDKSFGKLLKNIHQQVMTVWNE